MKVGDNVSRLYNDQFADILRAKINVGEFKSKEELIQYMNNINMVLFNDPELMRQIKEKGISLKYEDINALTQDLLEYYDKSKDDLSTLDLEGVSHVDIEGTDYIKVKNEDGTFELLDDSMNNDDFVTQFKDRQNESYNFQTDNGVKNREQIVDDMKHDKSEAHLYSSNSINTRDLTLEERREFLTVMHMSDSGEINFVVDPARNIYINKDTGETFYVHKNAEGKLEVRRAGEVTAKTIQKDDKRTDDVTNDVEVNVQNPIDLDFNNLSDDDLQYIYETRFNTLTPEQQQTLLNLLNRRKERTLAEKSETLVKEQEKVKKLELLMEPHNGFTSILYLSIVSLIAGVGMLLYMILKIYL